MDISSVAPRSVATAASSGARGFERAGPIAPIPTAPKTAAAGSEVATQTPSPERIAQAVKQVNDDFIQKGRNLYASYERDKTTGINVVKVLDKNTREVISQFPSKEIIAIAESIDLNKEGKGQLVHISA